MDDLLDRPDDFFGDRYRLERKLGQGGMAIVYLALDLKHRRQVAVKVLRPELARALGGPRFLREIQIAARLNHPNILPLHESGDVDGLLYFIMPYVEGESLRDRLNREKQLPVETALHIAREVAGALSYAHGQGVIHRDIKPENILLQAGHAVVSDFGIAKAISEAAGDRLTETGLAVGTPAYMSTEQAAGNPDLDARTDIYSLACVLYEMLAGSPPYVGATPQAIMARKAVDPVPSLRVVRETVPPQVEQALTKALAKVPADRFATAEEFSDALARGMSAERVPVERGRQPARAQAVGIAGLLVLALAGGSWWVSRGARSAGAVSISSLAVLPFANISGDPDKAYLADGMQDALIGELAKIGSLRVISRTSAMKFRDSPKTVPEIARALSVNGIVEASVSTAGDRVRIQVQLIQAQPVERELWTRSYERDVPGVLTMYAEVARAIAREIRVKVTPEEETRLATARRVNPESYEAYLKGRFYLNKFTPEGTEKGLALLKEAIEKDPTNPLPYAGLALGYSLIGHGSAPPADAFAQVKAAALKALELDETLGEAHEALAERALYGDWDWVVAEREFQLALRFNPTLPEAHAHYAWYLMLNGRLDEALIEMRRAEEVDPLTPLYPAWLGWLYWTSGQPDSAVSAARKALDLNPNFPWAFLVLGGVYADKKMFGEAIEAHQKGASSSPAVLWALGRTYALAGRKADARKVAAQMEKDPTEFNPWGLAEIYATLGDNERAIQALQAGFISRMSWMPWIKWNPVYEPLHDDPRYQELVRRLNLPD